MIHLLDSLGPPDSGMAVYFNRDRNIWFDEDETEHMDLKDFGFTALQRETLLEHIWANLDDGYLSVFNDTGNLVEIYWDRPH